MKVHQFDCVVSFHRNIYTCGVARFNQRLAGYLGVPMISVQELSETLYLNPFVSIKRAEIPDDQLNPFLSIVMSLKRYSLILHDYEASDFENVLLRRAERVVALNSHIADQVKGIRKDVVSGFAVSSYEAVKPDQKADLKLITFGMAHKIQARGYFQVGKLLSQDSRSFVLEISSALHEGTQFDDSFFEVGDEISRHFQGNVDFLGFLADREVTRRLVSSSVMLAFFPLGARENNTSIISAMTLGVPVITNLDSWSPRWLAHGQTVFDIEKMERFPSDDELRIVGGNGRAATASLTFANLLDLLERVPEKNGQ